MFVADTDLCVDALRGRSEAVEGLAALERGAPLAVAAVTAHELWGGAFGADNPEREAARVARFLSAFVILPYDEATARIGGELAATLKAGGSPIGDLDTMIAATALAHGATLATRNARNFRKVRALPVHAL